MSNGRSTGSARRGLGEWLLQRFSGIYISGFVVYVVLHWLIVPTADFADWRNWLESDPLRVFATLFFASTTVHAWLGMRSVFVDYLHPLWLRLTVSLISAASLLAFFVWSVDVLWRLSA